MGPAMRLSCQTTWNGILDSCIDCGLPGYTTWAWRRVQQYYTDSITFMGRAYIRPSPRTRPSQSRGAGFSSIILKDSLHDKHLGFISMATICFVFVGANFLSPTVVNFLGPRAAMFGGMYVCVYMYLCVYVCDGTYDAFEVQLKYVEDLSSPVTHTHTHTDHV
jgi:hypothetical protein